MKFTKKNYIKSDPIQSFGLNIILRKYLCVPNWLPLIAHMEHGWTPLDEASKTDLNNKKYPLMFVYNKRRFEIYKKVKHNYKNIFILGMPFILYRKKEKISIKEDAKGTIVFPSHDGTFVKSIYNINSFCEELSKLSPEYHPITICLFGGDEKYKKDIYNSLGYKIVTAGDRYNVNFYKNFYEILKRYKYAISNGIGSHVFYSIDLNIPFFLLGEEPVIINKELKDPNVPEKYKGSDFSSGKKAYNIFNTGPVTYISENQKKYVENEIGIKNASNRYILLLFYWSYFFQWVCIKLLKKILRLIKKIYKKSFSKIRKIDNDMNYKDKYNDLLFIFDKYVNHAVTKAHNFDFNCFSNEVITFVQSMKIEGEKFSYRYAPSVPEKNIYNSIYACLLYFLLGKNVCFSNSELLSWGEYINSFQREDGFYIDKNIETDRFYKIDWWGARHLSPHVIIALNYIGIKPKYEFNYIKKYYNEYELKNYLNFFDFENIIGNDFDNAIMNLGVILQYQRDFFGDAQAEKTLDILFDELEKQINPKWGSWGYGSDDDMKYLSRSQQVAYHLYPLWFYDKRPIKHTHKLIDLTLKTQTILGGFGWRLNSSACEDIDAIDLLVKLAELTTYRKDDIDLSLRKAFPWVLSNQNIDGGFVFNRNDPFQYGHALMSSKKNESHLFATWFRTLSIAYLTQYLKINNNFNIGRCPGMQF